MLKGLAILAVLLLVTNAGFPSPRETANPKGNPGASKAQASPSQQPSTTSATGPSEPSKSQTFNPNANEKTAKDGWDKAAVLSNYLLVVIGIGGIFAALCTFRAIEDQVIEMRSTGKQTDKLIQENIAQSASLERSVAETARSAAAMEGVSKSLESTVKVSSETLQGLRKQMRAYLTVTVGGGMHQSRESNLKFDARPLLVNAGPTPARNVRHRIKAAILPIPLPGDFDDTIGIEKEEGGNMMGAHQNAQMMGVVDDYVPDDQIEDIKIGRGAGIYAWGIVTYEDVFGDSHTTKFCQRLTWLPDGNVFGYYIPGRNDAD
ncbi:MAG: hypothetical protein WB608_24935 [Terracidiphilus sp.]